MRGVMMYNEPPISPMRRKCIQGGSVATHLVGGVPPSIGPAGVLLEETFKV